jgi:Cytochrome P450
MLHLTTRKVKCLKGALSRLWNWKGTLGYVQVDAVLGDRRPTLDDIRALGFTTRCLNESMRLYPQPPVLIRRALEDDIVGGYRVGVPWQRMQDTSSPALCVNWA